MLEKGQFTFLGTGGSMGVPVIGCNCSVCTSSNSKNKRLRCSALMQVADKKFLFDCGPDFRQQMLNAHIHTIDGLIFTHAHYDHTGGFDEIRIFNAYLKKPLPCVLSKTTLDELASRFPYVFNLTNTPTLTTKVDITLIKDHRGTLPFLGIPLQYMTYEQGGMLVNGFRIGNLAYISDIHTFPESIYKDLEGIETLVVSCLRIDPSPLHFNVEDAVAFALKTKAKRAFFTHIAHELEHDTINAILPDHCKLAYDGLSIDFEVTL